VNRPTHSFLRSWHRNSRKGRHRLAIHKDIVTTAGNVKVGSELGPDAVASASATLDQGHDATPDDMGRNRTAAAVHLAELVGAHSSRVVGRADRQNLRNQGLGAGPRATQPPPAAPLLGPPALRAHAAGLPSVPHAPAVAAHDSAVTVADDVPGPRCWLDTNGCCASDAIVWLPAGMMRYSSALADRSAGTVARSPSADSTAAGGEKRGLEPERLRTDTEAGPRSS
jgi:hypothetical protein